MAISILLPLIIPATVVYIDPVFRFLVDDPFEKYLDLAKGILHIFEDYYPFEHLVLNEDSTHLWRFLWKMIRKPREN